MTKDSKVLCDGEEKTVGGSQVKDREEGDYAELKRVSPELFREAVERATGISHNIPTSEIAKEFGFSLSLGTHERLRVAYQIERSMVELALRAWRLGRGGVYRPGRV